MKNVEESLKSGASSLASIINNAKFDFDLGDNFQPINDKVENYEQLVNTVGTSYTVDLTSKIKYTKTNDKDSEGKTKYTAQPFDITFKIKSSVGKYGNLGFSGLVFKEDDYVNNQLAIYGTDLANNNFVYEDINGVTTNPIKTPVVKIGLRLDHGVYQGLYKELNNQAGMAIVDNGLNKALSFPLGSVVTFASNISKVKGNIAINLKIDDNLEMNSLPTLYEYKNRTLSKLKGSDGNEITLSEVSGQVNQYKRENIYLSDKSNIIVLYSVKFKATKNSDYRNKIWINDGTPVDAWIKQSNNPLPDLF